MTKRWKRHNPVQIVRKLRVAAAMINDGEVLAAVLQALEVSESTYDRKLQMKAGDVPLAILPLRNLPFATEITGRYRRSRCTWPASRCGVSMTSPKHCGIRGTGRTVSEVNQKTYTQIEPGGTSRSRASTQMFPRSHQVQAGVGL